MSEPEIILPSDPAEVLRRCHVLRNHYQMSRTAFGNIETVIERGDNIGIMTTKHQIWIPNDLWVALGSEKLRT